MSITIPEARAKRHGGEAFYTSGQKFAETLVDWGGLGGDDRILDIGCGPGRMAIGIGERFGWTQDYLGLDVILQDVEVAKAAITALHPGFRFHHLDVYNGLYNPKGTMPPAEVSLPVDPGTIDFAFAASLFTHMFDADTDRYVQEVARTLKPGGTLLSTWFVWNDEVADRVAQGNTRFSFGHVHDDGTRTDRPDLPEEVIAFDQSRIESMFHNAGLEVSAFHRGAWPRLPGFKQARHSQDCYVCRKV